MSLIDRIFNKNSQKKPNQTTQFIDLSKKPPSKPTPPPSKGSTYSYNSSDQKKRGQKVASLREEGIDLCKAQRFREAIKKFDEVLLISPMDVTATRWKGLAEQRLADQSSSRSQVNPPVSQVTASTPYPTHLRHLGIDLCQQQRYDEAIVVFDKLLAISSNDQTAIGWKNHAQLQLAIQKSSGGPQAIGPRQSTAPPANPGSTASKIRQLRQEGIDLCGQKRYVEAIKVLDQLLIISPLDQTAIRYRDLARQRLGQLGSQPMPSTNPPKTTIKPPDLPVKPKSQIRMPEKRNVDNKDIPLKIFCTMIEKHGFSNSQKRSRFKGLLADYYGNNYKQETKILLESFDLRIPQEMLKKKDSLPFNMISSQLSKKLIDLGFRNDLAEWAINAWAAALKI